MDNHVSSSVTEALDLLRPVTVLNHKKTRVGNATGDGGYVMFDIFNDCQFALCYGISDDVSFEMDLAERGVCVALFDHTIEALPDTHERFRFFKKGLGPARGGHTDLASVGEHLEMLGWAGNGILKVDVEGWEYPWLMSESSSTLARFSQIAIEIHDLERLGRPDWRNQFVQSMKKLLATHVIAHIHANNNVPVIEIEGQRVAPVLEATFIRRDAVVFEPNNTVYPIELDFCNQGANNDIVLDFFPFLPEGREPVDLNLLLETAQLNSLPPLERLKPYPEIDVVGRNIASMGTARQSSLSEWSFGPAEANGPINGSRTGRAQFHTSLEERPWWQLDFRQAEHIDEILIFNRVDGAMHRAYKLVVEISEDGLSWQEIHRQRGKRFGGIDGDPLRVSVGASATSIRLWIDNRTYFHLDQVEVYQRER